MRLESIIITKSKLKSISQHSLFYWAVLGILLRYAIGLYTSWSPDVEIWYRTGMSILHGAGVYDFMYFAYPPVWGYILGFFVKIGGLVFDPRNFAVEVPELHPLSLMTGMISTTITSPTFNFIFKTPLFIFDFLVGYILYRFVYEITNSITKAKSAFIMWFFNPLVIVVSAVHGTFDTIATSFILLAVILIYKKNYFWGGAMWMLGVLTKIFPLYFIFIFIGFVFLTIHNTENIIFKLKKIIKNFSLFSLGAILSFCIIILPLVTSGTFNNFIRATFLGRQTTGIIVGGFSPWFIRWIPEYSWVTKWAYNNSSMILKYSTITSFFLLSILGIFMTFLMNKQPLRSLVYGSILTLIIVYLTSPLVGPRYLIWIMPFMILYAMIYNQQFKHIPTIISFSGIIYYFSLQSHWVFFLPLVVYTNLIDAQTIYNVVESFWYTHGFLNKFLRDDLKLISSFMGITAMILCLHLGNIMKLKMLIAKRWGKM